MPQFTFHTPENAQGEAKQILENIKAKYGFIPSLFNYMAEAPYLIEAYGMLTELMEKTDLTPAQQQVALLAVSHYHNCDFCRIAHQAFGKKSNANAQTLNAIINDGEIEDPKDKALVEMIIAIVDSRGCVNDKQLQTFFDAGFSKRNVYDLILITTIKTLSNYSNHLTKPEANPELKAMI